MKLQALTTLQVLCFNQNVSFQKKRDHTVTFPLPTKVASIGFGGITFHIYLLSRANCIITIVTLITIFVSLHRNEANPMMFYDILCLKSILGFLLSERTSGVSPFIFILPAPFQPSNILSILPTFHPSQLPTLQPFTKVCGNRRNDKIP